MKVNAFDVFKKMTDDNNPALVLAPIGNIINMQKTKRGDKLTIGVPSGYMMKVYNGEVVGGLILCDKKEFNRIKQEMENDNH